MIVPGGKTFQYSVWAEPSKASGIVTGREVQNDLKESGWGGMDWIDLAQNRERRRTLANAATYLGFYRQRGIS